MQRDLDNLDRRIVSNLNVRVLGQGQIRDAESAREGVPAGARDLKHRRDDVGHVWRLVAVAHVDVKERGGMACVPAWDNG